MATAPSLEELRLTRFKSFRDAVLPLRDLTLLIGRNGSGKSNAIDALHVLERLADGDDVREAIDGNTRDGGAEVRGGTSGCAPHGEASFALGCTVRRGDDRIVLDVEIAVEPHVQIIGERLELRPRRGAPRTLLAADPPQDGLVDITARYRNGRTGPNPAESFRSDRLLTAQVPARVPASNQAMREVHDAARAVLETLRAIFILDPVPAMMRQYVPRRDARLRRRADNLSAVISDLSDDALRWDRLREVVSALPEQEVARIAVEASPLDDVMLVLYEHFGGRDVPVSARAMSDGMLRFLAFAAALLEAPETGADSSDQPPNTHLVIEEIENGLHPSQAAQVVRLIKQEAEQRLVRTLATTHSPAILSALEAEDHRGVIVCRRDPETAVSRLIPLVDLPRYPEAMASGTLGDAVTESRLEDGPEAAQAADRALDDLLAQL